MRLFRVEGWLESPLDRDVIARWTVGDSATSHYNISLPQPADPNRFSIFALGDTGDSEAAGPYVSPQDAVAREMAGEFASDNPSGAVASILHVGDVVYMTGERRCYDRNFRRPYQPFLTPESTVDNLTFRVPFLPVPGNHDYYDLGVWARFFTHVPLLGRGLRALAHQIFTFSLPTGGSGMGAVYMRAFVDPRADTTAAPLEYIPGKYTRLPNRYYHAELGNVDIFALDSTTLEAPAPSADDKELKAAAATHVRSLEERAKSIEQQMRRDQRALEEWRSAFREKLVEDAERLASLLKVISVAHDAFEQLAAALKSVPAEHLPCDLALHAVKTVSRRWVEAATDLSQERDPAGISALLQSLDEASDAGCDALDEVEQCLSQLPEGEARTRLLAAHEAVVQALHQWSVSVSQAPPELAQALQRSSDEVLDLQREIALERRRQRYRADDYDRSQLEWLDRTLSAAVTARPDAWRIVFMHHPLYTTIRNHCERADVIGLRENLMEILRNRVHVVLSGHSHSFEWIRSSAMPETGICVTGGGGALSLRPSILDPRRFHRSRDRYDSLRHAGVAECAVAGRGPAASDGEAGALYHFLRLEIEQNEIRIRPIGVRRLATGYRREQPMPVYHAAELGVPRPPWQHRTLEYISVRRGEPPAPHWGTDVPVTSENPEPPAEVPELRHIGAP